MIVDSSREHAAAAESKQKGLQNEDRFPADTTLQRIQNCKLFCSRVSETASMHSPPVSMTEVNLHRLLQSALSEIHQQLEGLESDFSRQSSIAGRPDSRGEE
mmetsp:Transcript_10522/g.29948  ORF Transcript_10522/g.29948 Transcript_10522/m.29948 type:complete len:102 (+) Transcript_10522:522-827(+)